MRSATRQRHERKGRLAEALAVIWLRLKGYRILEQRWKHVLGEIDIIATRGGALIFVEVKARRTDAAGRDAVTWRNRRRIEAAADAYVSARRLTPVPPYRFDIITVAGWRPRHRLNAWRSGD